MGKKKHKEDGAEEEDGICPHFILRSECMECKMAAAAAKMANMVTHHTLGQAMIDDGPKITARHRKEQNVRAVSSVLVVLCCSHHPILCLIPINKQEIERVVHPELWSLAEVLARLAKLGYSQHAPQIREDEPPMTGEKLLRLRTTDYNILGVDIEVI
jgi:hypothetical protein